MNYMYSLLLLLVLGASHRICQAKDNLKSSDDKIYDVVVVGGGFSGLFSSYFLEKKDVLILEKSDNVGGRCLTGEWNGFHYPKGTEYIGKPERYMRRIFRDLDVHAKVIPAPTDGVAYGGKFYFGKELLDYMTNDERRKYFDLMTELRELDHKGIEKAVWSDIQKLNKNDYLDKLSVEEWMMKKGYPPIVQKFVDVENRGLFGTNNANYSMLFNIPEMTFDLPDNEASDKSEVYSFENGMYSIVESLEERLKNRLIKGAEVAHVSVGTDNIVKVCYQKEGKSYQVRSRSVVMATPAPITAKILGSSISLIASDILKSIDYTSYITVSFFTKKRMLHRTWSVSCLDMDEIVTLYDAIRPQVSNDYRGKSILSAYLAPKDIRDSNFVRRSDKEILERTYRSMNKYFNSFQDEVIGYDITRFAYAFPVFSPGYLKKLICLTRDQSLKGPIFLAGDYMVYATVDGALISAENAADDVLSFLRKY
ncbi:FAD-dependent oxidoreductase [Halosquirtibacter xylanolyticus]|uniref:FAD-dependent oxidoreductase n=1 Tax=Halosquirtibacter xylanolyticus TaxID=3374599 RepID=UPI00374A94E2|nr:FAD-dependent oxidoreductase [Prolixibacteraceae bacterium]